MFNVKEITIGTYENYYKRNIQMQFLSDSKFTTFMKYLCTKGSDYQTVLKTYCEQFNLDTQATELHKFVLNTIGELLGLPPVDYFSVTIDGQQQAITLGDYIMLIKGQQLKNTWDGTNKGIVDNLTALFPDYEWSITETGIMAIDINMKGASISETTEQLFEGGWFTPKPAGVAVTYRALNYDLFTWDSEETNEKWENGKWI